jgi:8-oxo-dGTP pyrophosphatase MutT (NUDIX family)
MSVDGRNPADSRLTAIRPLIRAHEPAAPFVRLSQLRKLRDCEQVAAVCYRLRNGGIEFLLVQTRGSRRWTFPKGSAEPGLTHAQAAALEAFEEAGVHGRIEELSFARYVLRKQGGARKAAARSSEKDLAVKAHLCEVSRLSAPKESKRNRTWFSVEDARQRLGEGRRRGDGAEFARVVDRAVARIQRLRRRDGIVDDRPPDGRPQKDRLQPGRPRRDASQKDALQKVQFEVLAEIQGWAQEASLLPYIRRQLGGIRRSAAPAADAHRREVLECEVLQFEPPRGKKAKALTAGSKNG